MKKNLLIIPATILIVAVVLASVVLSRRDQYVNSTDAEDSGTTVFSSETVTEATSPNWLELYEQSGEIRGEEKWMSYSNSVYYFFGKYTDALAIHKDTKTIMGTLCRDAFCSHEDENCIFGSEWALITAETIGDRLYFLLDGINGECRLVSTDISLNDGRIEWEEEVGIIASMQADRGRLYFLENIYNEDTGEQLRKTVSWYSPSDQTRGYVRKNMAVYSYIVHEGVLYAQTEANRLVRCNVNNPIPETILEIEPGKTISMNYVDKDGLVFDVMTGWTTGELQRLDLDTLQVNGFYDAFPQEYSYIFGETFGNSTFLCIDHSGDTYKEDLHYDFYTDSHIIDASSTLSLAAGRIYYLNDKGQLLEVAQLTTDGVPDIIRSIVGYDGRFLYVRYATYKSFQNELNPDSDKRNPQYTHLAMIDTQTGQVYKLTETSGE